MPHGFALTFLDDVFDVRTRAERIRMTDHLLGFPRDFGEEMKIMLHLKLVQLLSAGYDRFNIEAQHNWVYLSPTTEAPIKLPLQNTQFS
jgi:lactate dehydrogenase-like 2-hydroxyacid dehydrogenase